MEWNLVVCSLTFYCITILLNLLTSTTSSLFHRTQQPGKYPRTPYTVFMKNNRIHLYTIIQIFFFAALYAVKTIKVIAIAFPFFILLCIPARTHLLPRIFEAWELIVLDGSPEEVEQFVEEKAVERETHSTDKLESGEGNGSSSSNNDEDDEEEEEDDDEMDDAPTPLISQSRSRDTDDNEEAAPKQAVDFDPDESNHGYTPELLDAAHRRTGRRTARRHKTVSDLSGMFVLPPETNWSHV